MGVRGWEEQRVAVEAAWVARGQNQSCPHIRLGPQVFGVEREDQLRDLRIPALVLHGTDDPMFPIGHGRALGKTLPLVTFEEFGGRGHDLHLHDRALHLVAEHTSRNDP